MYVYNTAFSIEATGVPHNIGMRIIYNFVDMDMVL